eukprot:CAMPEP_0170553598 /NCGR_PEP_ID=MMETSP0211-20121228/11433_1 /TAXON_ID=311385 /ORGANISM="Pseudokeronopsis sp., Strain OXSARD2" /LENGTH=101 /DNA_ID=CAMNT_0010862045 /DNA_START=1 /DNA_END=306 /DNA_ORIENTATION=-
MAGLNFDYASMFDKKMGRTSASKDLDNSDFDIISGNGMFRKDESLLSSTSMDHQHEYNVLQNSQERNYQLESASKRNALIQQSQKRISDITQLMKPPLELS